MTSIGLREAVEAHARLELLAGVGHAPWMDDPAAMASSVRAFLAA